MVAADRRSAVPLDARLGPWRRGTTLAPQTAHRSEQMNQQLRGAEVSEVVVTGASRRPSNLIGRRRRAGLQLRS